MDKGGMCRFHRGWAEKMIPEIFQAPYGKGEAYLGAISVAASRINSRNASIYWVEQFRKDRHEASLQYWFEVRKGIDESLRDFL